MKCILNLADQCKKEVVRFTFCSALMFCTSLHTNDPPPKKKKPLE